MSEMAIPLSLAASDSYIHRRAWSPQKCLGGFSCVFPNAWFQVLSFCLSPRAPSACLHGVLSLGMPSIITEMGPSARARLLTKINSREPIRECH
ncbi:hypothetical protein GGI42DRAFT_335280 [Trichoderma sp. SZMC 28013]